MKVKQVRSKYGARRTQINGITFASAAEAARYLQLNALEASGHISKLELQPKYELAPSVKYAGAARATPPLRYYGDFKYVDHIGNTVVEDVKGMATDVYRAKKHLMLAIHGIEIKEIRSRGKRASA